MISNPQGGIVKIPTDEIIVNKKLKPSWINYTDPLTNNVRGMNFDAIKCLNNSVFVTIIATIITVLINSMAAFALSKYRFNGQIIFYNYFSDFNGSCLSFNCWNIQNGFCDRLKWKFMR